MALKTPYTPQEGRPFPMGAHPRDGGVNFAVFSANAHAVEVCLYDGQGQQETGRWRLHGPRDGVFHGFVAGLAPGQVYGLRAHGTYAPDRGHRFNPCKLLLDPCAREIVGRFERRDEHHGHVSGHPDGIRRPDTRDNTLHALKARVVQPLGPQQAHSLSKARPRIPKDRMVLYEVHVKGFSRAHPGVPEALRGTYAGLAHPASVAHFKRLGITTLSLLPVHYALDEPHLVKMGKPNYWGYNTLGFFCVDPRWSCTPGDTAAATAEFRQMVSELHAAGLEVVIDVVYNHTAEGGEDGPTLSFRGLDNSSWYRLLPEDPSRCENLTGCGNTLAVWHPRVTQFVLDSLRHWVQEMGVDGFRFDLAVTLGRTRGQAFQPDAAFFTALSQDPVLADVHLIAEPWDSGPGGYQVGRFPGAFLDWNDRFRDAVRGYWLQAAPGMNHRAEARTVTRGEFARRLAASSDLFNHSQRRPSASVNFIAAHDGFALRDVVSYHRKHNLANGEDNRDGRDSELSANFGVEGPTDDAAINGLRGRVQRAMMATLLLAQGTPMLAAGDEIGKTQRGNNNAYCQDAPLSWLDWAQADEAMLDLVERALKLRGNWPCLRHDQWFSERADEAGLPKVQWLGLDGRALQPMDWQDEQRCSLVSVFDAPDSPQLMAVFHPHDQAAELVLTGTWVLLLDSSRGATQPDAAQPAVSGSMTVPARSVLVLQALHEALSPSGPT
jgi:glycogen operon protein